MNNIAYFNQISREIFGCLSVIQYSVKMIEINEKKGFIGYSLDMNQYSAQIIVILPSNPKYVEGYSCSMQMYDIEDENLEEPLFEVIQQTIENAIMFLVDEEMFENITAPKYHLN